MKTKRIEVDGREVEVQAVKAPGGVLWVHLDGETFTFETSRMRTAARGAKAVPKSDIVAPMPGKIVKILVAVGDRVTSGQTLLVMEAMKMEYTLKAPADASVTLLKAAAGDQVPLGQLLIKLSL